MIPILSGTEKRRLGKIYSEMSNGSSMCRTGCYRCCNDVGIPYVEFAYLIDGLSEKQLGEMVSKPLVVAGDVSVQKHGEIVDTSRGRAMTINPNLGKEKYFCPALDMDSGKCAAYEHRPWECRAYQMDNSGICMIHISLKTISRNMYAGLAITEENMRFAPIHLRMNKNVRNWLSIALK